MMRRERRSLHFPRAVILTEACVSLALVGLVLAVVSLLLVQHARTTDFFLNYRRVQLAAESCVERMRAKVLDIANADFTDEASVKYEIRVAEADEPWRPLVCVHVTASIVGHSGHATRYSLSTYLEPRTPLIGAGP